MAVDCNLVHKFARQNARKRLIDEGLINRYNEILDRPKLLERVSQFNEYAKKNYGINAKLIHFEDTKIIFNDAAFKAVDIMKGIVPHDVHDVNTAQYLNNVSYSPDEGTSYAFNPDDLFSEGESSVPPSNGLTRVVSLKQNLLTRAKRRLSDIGPELERVKGDATKFNELTLAKAELRDYIFGNDSKNIQGLEKEIADIKKIDSRAPEIIAPYIDKEIQRLGNLVKSSDPDHTAEAATIIDFIKSMADFNAVNISRSPNGHPLYDISELYDKDGNFLLTPAMAKPFKDWAEIAVDYEDKLAIQSKNIVENIFNNNQKIRDLYKKEFTYDEIINSRKGLKDIQWIDMMVMDVSSGIFSHNGVMPQVVKNLVDNAFEKHSAWSKEVEEKTDKILPQVQEELKKLGHSLDGLGLIGIKGVSYDLFRQKLPDDVQSNNNIAGKFSYTYQDKLEDMQNKFDQNIKQAYQFDGDNTAKAIKFRDAFNARNKFLRDNTKLINPALLSAITDNPEFKDLRQNFKFTKEQQDQHEAEVKATVGEDYFNKIVVSQTKKIHDYLVQAKNYENGLLATEAVSTQAELSDNAVKQFQIWRAQNSPFLSNDYLSTNLPIRINSNDYHSNFDYNEIIPLKTKDGKDLNHYDKNYEFIEQNPILKEFHDLLTETMGEMYDRFDYDEQQKLTANSIPLLERKMIEIFLDKNLTFYQAISEAFRRIIDKFKGGFGINVQDQFNYAKVNPNTGLPDYKVNDQFIKQNTQAVQNLFKIKSIKFATEFTKLGHFKIDSINKFTAIASAKINNDNLAIINKFTGKQYSKQELIDQYGESIPIGKIILQNAQHEVAQGKSFDLPKIMKYYAALTAQYSARKEMLPTAELMKNHYEGIKNQVTQNTGDARINNETNNTQLNGLRTNANKQFDNWFQRVILGNNGLRKHYGIMKAGDQMTEGEKSNYLNKFFGSIANATKFDGKIYDIQEKKVIAEIDQLLKSPTISKEDTKELEDIKSKLGKDAALSATIDSLLTFTLYKGLAFNLSSGLTNFIEGQVANTISASTGMYFPEGYLDEVTPTDMIRSDMIKQFNPGGMSEKVAKAYFMAKRMDVLQDNSNELQRASAQSAVSNLHKFAPMYVNQKGEQYNQIPLMVATLKDHMITGIDGQKSSIWDALHGEYDSKSKQWEFTLKPDFASEVNKSSWEHFQGEDYYGYKTKIRQIIKNTHGDFDPTSGMMAKSTNAGKAALTFKTWLPREFYKRFATTQDDIHSGIAGFKGRYHSHTGITGAMQGGIVGTFLLGPAGGIIGAGIGGALASKYGAATQIDVLTHLLETNKILFKKMMGMPVNFVGRLLGKDNLINSEISDSLKDKFNFTQQDFANFKGNMQEMSIQLAYIALLLLTKAMFWDDDDKPDDLERQTHNLLANRFMQLAGASTMYLNPVETGTTVLSIPMLKFFQNTGKTISALDKFMQGKDIITSGANAGHSRLMQSLQKTFVPGIGASSNLGFGAQMKQQFTPSPYDDYFKSEENKNKAQLKADKAVRKLELEEQFQDIEDEDQRHTAVIKELNKEFPKAKSHKKKIGLYN